MIQRLQSINTEQKKIWKNIILIVGPELLYNIFEITTTPLPHFGDKDFKKIKQMVTSTKVGNLAKCVVETIANLIILAKKKHLNKQYAIKSNANEKYFNCKKKKL